MLEKKKLIKKANKRKTTKKKQSGFQRWMRNQQKEKAARNQKNNDMVLDASLQKMDKDFASLDKKSKRSGHKKNFSKAGHKNKTALIIIGILLILAAATGLTVFVINYHKEQEKQRRLEAMNVMEEARRERRQKEKDYAERVYLEGVRSRVQTADDLQKAWEDLWLEEIPLTAENEDTFAAIDSCLISDEDSSLVEIKGTLPGIPESDSDDIYLFALNTYETSIPDGAEPADTFRIEKTKAAFTFHANLNNRQANSRMFKKFVVAAKVDGKYKIISRSRYITNPEAVAKYNVYTPASSIKGLLVDPSRLNTGELEDLGVKQAAYNIPLSKITGQTTSANYPTIHYTYNGRTYAIDGRSVAEYDIVFGSLSRKGIRVTAIVLNDMNYEYPELVHPDARNGVTAPYVMFNGAEEAGVNTMAAITSFLAERYSGTGHGTISNWVIANEINARSHWNYMKYTDVYTYTKEYAQAFRVFYNAIKSVNASAEIYMPLDQTWNRNLNDSNYDARDIIDNFNTIIKEKGNIDWQLAYHPYPVPLTNAAFWNTGAYFKKLTVDSVDTAMINMKNIHVVTDYLCRDEFLMDSGEARHVLLSEQGFTSSSGGEGVQAAAFAYAYYISEANSHINGFLLNRQTDAPEEVAQGLAFGLNYSNGGRKQIYNVFKKIDTPDHENVTEFAKSILGISDWSSVITHR